MAQCGRPVTDAFLQTVSAGIASGEIRYREDITNGLAQTPSAFIRMLEGWNFGKLLVHVGDPSSSH
jgi:NADPH-dependent curcumin reductase